MALWLITQVSFFTFNQHYQLVLIQSMIKHSYSHTHQEQNECLLDIDFSQIPKSYKSPLPPIKKSNHINDLYQTQKSIVFCAKLLLGLVVAVAMLKVILGLDFRGRQYQDVYASPPKDLDRRQEREFVSIETSFGNIISLPYQKPTLISPPHVFQSPLPAITLQKNPSQYAKLIQDMGTPFQMSKRLFMNWFNYNELLFQAEYFHLNRTYQLDTFVSQRGICIISPLNNLMRSSLDGIGGIFLKSLNQQNYSNYRLYLIDDGSHDNSVQFIHNNISQYPRLNNRLWILQNEKPIGQLANLDIAIRNYCQPGQIVMKVNAGDALIGRQVLNLINRIYLRNSSVWFAYSNYALLQRKYTGSNKIFWNIWTQSIHSGINTHIDPKVLKSGLYRFSSQWVTNSFQSFLRDAYVKIPMTHLLERGIGTYYRAAADEFITYALVELAGPNHTFYYPEFLYLDFVQQPHKDVECYKQLIEKCKAIAQTLPPLQSILSIQNEPRQVQKYKIPLKLMANFVAKQRQLLICSEKKSKISMIFDEG